MELIEKIKQDVKDHFFTTYDAVNTLQLSRSNFYKLLNEKPSKGRLVTALEFYSKMLDNDEIRFTEADLPDQKAFFDYLKECQN